MLGESRAISGWLYRLINGNTIGIVLVEVFIQYHSFAHAARAFDEVQFVLRQYIRFLESPQATFA